MTSASPQVRTLVVTDLVNSTQLVEQLTDVEAAALIREIDGIARSLLPEHDGLEIDKTDGYLLLFERPIDGIRFMIALHDGLEMMSERTGHVVMMRAGIHVGEVVLWENPAELRARGAKPIEVEGLAKPVTARLMSLAPGGRTLLSRSARDLAMRAGPDLRYLSHGTYTLKGVSEPFEVYEVAPAGDTPLPSPAGTAKVRKTQERRIRWVPTLVAVATTLLAMFALIWWSQRTTESFHLQLTIDEGGYAGLWAPHATDLERVRVVRQAGRVAEAWFETARGHPKLRVLEQNFVVPGDMVRKPYRELGAARVAGLRQHWAGDRVERVDWLDINGEVMAIEHWEADGEKIRRRWTTPAGAPMMGIDPDVTHTFATRLSELDDRGREVWSRDVRANILVPWATRTSWTDGVMTIAFEDLVGNPMSREGVASVTYHPDPNHPLGQPGYVAIGIEGSPADFDGCASIVRVYDDDSVRVACTNRVGAVPADRCPVEETSTKKDGIWDRCLDANGDLLRAPSGPAIHKFQIDDRGLVHKVTYANVAGEPTVNSNGVAAQGYTFDDGGRLVWNGPALGIDGTPMFQVHAGYGYRDEYDRRGMLVARTFVDHEGQASNTGPTFATQRWSYDAEGRPVEVRYFNADGDPTLFARTRHLEKFSWDGPGYGPSETAWFDTTDRQVAGADGVHSRRWEWDPTRTAVSITAFTTDGKPTLQHIEPNGNWIPEMYVGITYKRGQEFVWCHGLVSELDDDGFRTTCTDAAGEQLSHAFGWSRRSVRFLDGGRVQETRLLTPDGELAKARRGWARQVQRLERGQVVETLRYDQYDGLIRGCAKTTYEYDAWGNVFRTSCRDSEDHPTPSSEGCAVKEMVFEGRAQVAEQCKDGDGNLVQNQLRGYAALGYVNDEQNFHIQRIETSVDGSVYTEFRENDALGRIVAIWAERDGEPVPIRTAHPGTHRLERDYGPRGDITEHRRFPVKGQELPDDVPPIERIRYDERGMKVSMERWNHDGEPVTPGGLPNRTRYRHDNRRRLTRRWGENDDGTPALLFGCWIFEREYEGTLLTSRCLDQKEQLMVGVDGRLEPEVRTLTDDRGRRISKSAWGVSGEPALFMDEGVHEIRSEWSTRNQIRRRSYFDSQGQPASERDSDVSIVVHDRDERDATVAVRFLGVDGEPVMLNDCYGHGVSIDFDGVLRPTSCMEAP